MPGNQEQQDTSPARKLVRVASSTLWKFRDAEAPAAFLKAPMDFTVYKRLMELMAEHCYAVDVLCETGLFRVAHSVLRSFLETAATTLWVTLDVPRYGCLFLDGKLPNMREILKRVGWESEYESTYQPLSKMVHPDPDSIWMYRKVDYAGDDVSPELLPNGENYVTVGPNGKATAFSTPPLLLSEAAARYEPFLGLKCFDLTLCCLVRLFGECVKSGEWWPGDAVRGFQRLADVYSVISKNLLWYKLSER